MTAGQAMFVGIALVVLAGGCCAKAPKRQTIKTITVQRSCLGTVGRAPTIPDTLGTDNSSTDKRCDPYWELCADAAATDKLVAYIRSAKRWIAQAEISCKENDNENSDTPIRSGPSGNPGNPIDSDGSPGAD